MSEKSTHFPLNPEIIEQAEQARNRGQWNNAMNLATSGLDSFRYDSDNIRSIAHNPEELAMVLCLARIHVDSLKSAANRSKFPREVLHFLLRATDTINDIYDHPAIQKVVADMNKDHVGRTHYFLPEMQRDTAKILFASTILYSHDVSQELTSQGEQLLLQTYNSLPDRHPVKPLIGIEYHISRLSQGEPIQKETLLKQLYQLLQTDGKENPHRVATVSSWLAAYGIEEAEQLFFVLAKKHPEWNYMKEQEQSKLSKQEIRKKLFRVLTPVTTSNHERNRLYNTLISVFDTV